MRIGTDDNKLSGDAHTLEIEASGSTQVESAGKVVVSLPGGGSQPANGFDRVVFSNGTGIATAGIDGRGVVQHTTQGADLFDYVGMFEPTQRRLIAFQRYVNATGRYDIFTVDTLTGTLTNLTAGFNPDGQSGTIPGAANPAWSPDGRRILFVAADADSSGNSLWTMNADGSAKTKIVGATYFAEGGSNVGSDAPSTWSPDGSRVAFGVTDSGDDSTNGLYIANADGTGVTLVVGTTTVSKVLQVLWLATDQLAHTTHVLGNGHHELHLVNLDGSGSIQVGGNNPYYISRSADGSRFAVGNNDSTATILGIDGTETALPLPNFDGYPIGWVSVGAGPWSSNGAIAANLDPDTATAADLVNAMIASGQMAAA